MLNRIELLASLQQLLDQAPDEPNAVLWLRILRMREFDLLFGYEAGERLDRAAAERIAASLRPADRVLATGHGEFAVLLPCLLNANHALLAAQRLVRAFAEPLELGDTRMLATVVVGAAVAPDHASDPEALVRGADIACGRAAGRNERIALHDARQPRLDVSYDELHRALGSGELRAHLQPIIALDSGRLVGAESLARWNNPRVGWVRPELFVALAEQTGLIGELTRWSLNATLRHGSEAGLAGREDLRYSVNLSPLVFREPDFTEHVLDSLRLWDLPGHCLTLEITEGALMQDPAHSAEVLGRLADAGIRIAVDDFGTGYSSFAWLRQLPAQELKIDQSFVRELPRDPRSAQLVRSIIDLAHHLDMDVVAEGVADAETQSMLAEMGCDRAQGFHIGRAVDAGRFAERLQAEA